jgi:hypothetical protein
VHFGTPLDGRAPQKDKSIDATMILQFKILVTWGGLQRIDRDTTSRYYHTAKEQGVLTGRALYKHHTYTRLGYLA